VGPYTPSLLLEPEIEADLLLDQAVEFCKRRLGKSEREVRLGLAQEDPEVHSTLRYAIAKGLSEHLGRLGRAVRAVYVYGSAMNGDAGACSDIDLVVIVGHKLDQAVALLRRLDLALVTSYRALIECERRPASLLDVHLVDVEEEEKRHGYGAVVCSTRTSPVCLWRYTPRVSGAPLAGSPHASSLTARG
jgi:predicted nucleotidyltransferase